METEHDRIVSLIADKWKKPGCVVLWNYKNLTIEEEPDVFVLSEKGEKTTLYEVKTSTADYHRDALKPFRNKLEMAIGTERYYVVPRGMILKEETGDWGLIYVDGNKTRTVKKSATFNLARSNHVKEMRLVSHAFRKYASKNGQCNVFASTYGFD